MKRVATLAIVLVFLFALAPAVAPASASSGPTFTVSSNITAMPGTTVTVPIMVTNNPGFTAAGLLVEYNSSVLELTSVTAPIAAMPLNPEFRLTTNQGVQWIHLVQQNLTNWSGTGTVINMTFNVRAGAALGISGIYLSFTTSPNGDPVNAAGDTLWGATTASGSVNVVANPAAAFTFTAASNVSATRGNTVTVPVTVSNNPGFTSVAFDVDYNSSVLEIRSVTARNTAMPLSSQFALTTTPGRQRIHLINTNLADWGGGGALVDITFNVRSNASTGVSAVTLSFADFPFGEPANAAGHVFMDARTASGSVNVSGGGGDQGGWDGWDPDPGSGGGATPQEPNHWFTEGNAWTQGSGQNLELFIEKGFHLFSSVSVNGDTIFRNSQYQARAGSTIVTLFANYLETLSTGWHTVTVRFTDNATATAYFRILENWSSWEPPPDIDDGFIGNPYPDDLDQSTDGTDDTSKPGTGGGFGRPPQTGLPDISLLALAACMSLIVTVPACLFAVRRIRMLLKSSKHSK